MQLATSQAGEIHIVRIEGDVGASDVVPLASAIQAILNSRGLNLVLDMERTGTLCEAAVGAIRELARKLGASGGALVLAGAGDQTLGNHLESFKANPDVIVAENRGLGMSILLNRLSVRGELLGYIREALATTYLAPHSPQPVTCRFLKNLQNFLVYALEPPYDGTLARGMTLRFTMTGCGQECTKTVSFDGKIYRFAALKDGTPCLMVKVPDLLEIEEDRREDPRIKVAYQVTVYDRNHPERKSYGTMCDLSAEGLSFRVPTLNHQVGQLIMVEPDFRRFKLREPISLEIVYVNREGGEVVVGGHFQHINPGDQLQINNLILDTSKW